MKGVITILMILLIGFGVYGQQKNNQQGKGGTKRDVKTSGKRPPVKPSKSVNKKPSAPVQQKVDTPQVAAMPADTGLITPNVTVDSMRAEPEEIVIWKDPEETFAWLPWLSLVIAVGMGVYVIWANSKMRVRLKKIENKKDDNFLGMTRDKPSPGISSLEVESLITSSPVLKKIQEECNAIRGMVEKLQPAAKVIHIHNNPVTPVEDSTFYMTGPTSNYFPANARSSHKENTVYKFVLQPGGNEAKFELHTMGASVSEIIKVIESYIKPACDEENLPHPGTRNIVTKQPGVAILESDKWMIKSKAIIRYE